MKAAGTVIVSVFACVYIYIYVRDTYVPARIWFNEARTRNMKAAGTVIVSRVSSNITSLRC